MVEEEKKGGELVRHQQATYDINTLRLIKSAYKANIKFGRWSLPKKSIHAPPDR